jgi:hypothetical protein
VAGPPSVNREPRRPAADRRGIGFGWLQNAWLLHARLKIHRGGRASMASTENTRAGSLRILRRSPPANLPMLWNRWKWRLDLAYSDEDIHPQFETDPSGMFRLPYETVDEFGHRGQLMARLTPDQMFSPESTTEAAMDNAALYASMQH